MTIYDIAKEAGVSASTVSRVMNNKRGVSPDKRRLVEALLNKYNFEPDASAQGLVSRSSKLIGIVVSDIRTQHHSESAYFIERQLQKSGYSCMIVNAGFSDERRLNGIRLLASRRVEAAVLIGSTFQTESVKRAIRKYLKSMPVIFENGYFDLPNVYSILADERSGIAECLRLLYRKQRKNPWFVSLDDTPSNRLKIDGFLTAWKQFVPPDTPIEEAPLFQIKRTPGGDDWDMCYEATKQLIHDHPQIDGIIYATDFLANAGERALLDIGVRIPEQISLIGVDNSIYTKLSNPRLTTLDNKMRELSMACASSLVQILEGGIAAHRTMLLSDIIEAETT